MVGYSLVERFDFLEAHTSKGGKNSLNTLQLIVFEVKTKKFLE